MGKIIKDELMAIISEMGVTEVEVDLNQPQLLHGDFTTNVAMILASTLQKSPLEIAQDILTTLKGKNIEEIEKIEVVKPGFINFWLKQEAIVSSLESHSSYEDVLEDKRYLVEYAHPNTHKEMHIGHMRTLITGEAVSRLLAANGADVFRANYQGDIGPHVAKALFGIQKIMEEKKLALSEIESWSNAKKAHFLGEGYVRGNIDYDAFKADIDGINSKLYQMLLDETPKDSVWELYQITRQWSLSYYQDFYERFYTQFDRLFFESEMVGPGKQVVEENIGKVFERDNDAVIFPGEKYGLHTRVFITKAGNPTYEGKEMGNGFAEYETSREKFGEPFDMKIHVVGSEQAGYFQVVFKALELIDPQKFEGRQHHISMGMVNLIGMKMSSRTGEILRVDDLIEKVKDRIRVMAQEGRIQSDDIESVTEMVAIGAIKYSVLKVGTGQNVAFDIEKSVSLEGDSGPYLQYTFARTQSVLAKSNIVSKEDDTRLMIGKKLEGVELDLLRFLYRFQDVVKEAGVKYSPNILCDYLFDLAKLYNLFYQKHKIIGSAQEQSRLALTKATGDILTLGLDLLGIKAPERM